MIFLGAEGTNATQWILPAVLLVLVVGIFILNYYRSKKNQDSMKNMVESLKVGDRVKTYSGFYGTILEIIETTDGKMAVLQTGSEKNKGIFSIDINAIYGIDIKQPVVLDAEGKPVEAVAEVETVENKPVEKKTKKSSKKEEVKEEPKAEEDKSQIVEEPKVEEIKAEEKKPAKKTTKKTTKKETK